MDGRIDCVNEGIPMWAGMKSLRITQNLILHMLWPSSQTHDLEKLKSHGHGMVNEYPWI